MKRPVDPRGSSGWFGPPVFTGLFTTASPASRPEDAKYCLEEPTREDEGASWGFASLPLFLPQFEDMTHFDEPSPRVSAERAGSEQEQRAYAEELAALRAELTSLRKTHVAEQRELRERMQEIERKFDDLLAMHDFDAEEAQVDPHARWIEQHFDKLREYPDAFVALDPERGILAHATEQHEFAAKLQALTPEENERVMLFHTSMYLRG